ncbi:MAG: metallophosphoesterase [Clostridiales bacterium]|nr:metallophosphoesterase [Clostridiales bacterium]
MSTYVTSDLHGYPLDKFLGLLSKAGFGEADMLYILGDVIDRNGDGGVSMLRYIMGQPNFEFVLGNHEDMLLNCSFLFGEVTDESISELSAEDIRHYDRWMRNGGGATAANLRKLLKEDSPAFFDLMQFLRESRAYAADTVKGRDFLFVHGGLKDFSPEKKLKDYLLHDLLWERPKLTDEYFGDVITVFGHTPTLCYGEEYRGRIIRTRTWINVDTGAADGLPPALLRLDDLEEFYGD